MEVLLQKDVLYSQRLRIAEQPGWLRTAATGLAHSGDSWFWLVGLGMVALLRQDGWRMAAIVAIAAIFVTAAVVFALKFTIRRQRPSGEWGQVYRKTDPHSFPSGHAARVAMLVVVAFGFAPTIWMGWILLVWAPLVALARVAMGVHYLSDVVAGLLLGVAIGAIVIWVV